MDTSETTKLTTEGKLDEVSNQLIKLMAECTVFHELDVESWKNMYELTKVEVESMSTAAVLDNYMGGLGSREYQTAITAKIIRLQMLQQFVTCMSQPPTLNEE